MYSNHKRLLPFRLLAVMNNFLCAVFTVWAVTMPLMRVKWALIRIANHRSFSVNLPMR